MQAKPPRSQYRLNPTSALIHHTTVLDNVLDKVFSKKEGGER
jgi:hypothetical protein